VLTEKRRVATAILLWGFIAGFAGTSLEAQVIVSFPDPGLDAAIRQAIDKPDGDIYDTDLAGLTTLNAASRGISNLDGLEYCTSLTKLHLWVNRITSVDVGAVTGLTGLTYLDLNINLLSSIDVRPLTNLTHLSLNANQLTEIDVSALTSLTHLDLSSNQLTDVDVSALTGLTDLNLSSNQLTKIDVSDLTGLTYLNLSSNQLTKIDVSPLTKLTWLGLDANHLTSIDVAGLTDLTYLGLYNNRLTTIDVNGLASLTRLGLGANRLTDIDLRTLTSLDYLDLCYNRLTSLSSLVANSGLANGDVIDLRRNPLSGESINVHIPALEQRSARVLSDAVCYDAPLVARIQPNSAANHSNVRATVTGLGFVNEYFKSRVVLQRSGHEDIETTSLKIANDGQQITCEFDLTGAENGDWDVVVTNPGGGFSVLEQAFTIFEPTQDHDPE